MQDCMADDEGLDSLLLEEANRRLSCILPKRLSFNAPAAGAAGNREHAQDGTKCPLQVVVRIRPGRGAVDEPIVHRSSPNELQLVHMHKKGTPTEQFTFSHVFGPETVQDEFYSATTAPLVQKLVTFECKSAVVMAYGSSGAGKTFSIEGTPASPGLLPRTLMAIFKALDATRDSATTQVSISHFELYQDQIYDLLDGEPSSVVRVPMNDTLNHPAGQAWQAGGKAGAPRALKHALLQPQEGTRRALRVREELGGQVVVSGLTQLVVSSGEHAIAIQQQGSQKRQQAATGINHASSRSHCIFTVRITETRPCTETCGPTTRSSSLSLVDLAGAERVNRTQNSGDRLKESCSINSSLSTLGRCIEALRSRCNGVPRVVPYRESKITHLFRDILLGCGGNFSLIVAVSPDTMDKDESAQVLRYASKAVGIGMIVLPPAVVVLERPCDALLSNSADARNEVVPEVGNLAVPHIDSALDEREVDVRAEIVAEIAGVIQEVRASCERRLAELEVQLEERDTRIAELEELLSNRPCGVSIQVHQAQQTDDCIELEPKAPAQAAELSMDSKAMKLSVPEPSGHAHDVSSKPELEEMDMKVIENTAEVEVQVSKPGKRRRKATHAAAELLNQHSAAGQSPAKTRRTQRQRRL